MPETEYHVVHGKLKSRCKSCCNEISRAYRQDPANRASMNAARREWYTKNRKAVLARRRRKARRMHKPERVERNSLAWERRMSLREKRIALFFDVGGVLPECACGCGDTVTFDQYGYPNVWLKGHNIRGLDPDVARDARFAAAPRVDAEKFRTWLKRFHDDSGMSWRQMAEKAGVNHGWINSVVYCGSGNKYGISMEIVEGVVRRLHDMPSKPSKRMLNEQTKLRSRRVNLGGGGVWSAM